VSSLSVLRGFVSHTVSTSTALITMKRKWITSLTCDQHKGLKWAVDIEFLWVSRPGCFEAAVTVSLRHTPGSGVNSTQRSIRFSSWRVRIQMSYFFTMCCWTFMKILIAWVFTVHIWESGQPAVSKLARITDGVEIFTSIFVLIYQEWFMFKSAGNPGLYRKSTRGIIILFKPEN